MKCKTKILFAHLAIFLLNAQAFSAHLYSSITSTPAAVITPLTINSTSSQNPAFEIKIVSFPSGTLMLQGIVYKPKGAGPFPTILFNHGSYLETQEGSDVLGPVFASHGWVFFMPSRRGQGLSRNVGHYISNEIEDARKKDGDSAAAETMLTLLKGDHFADQMAALTWLRQQTFVAPKQIAVAGVSFGGIQTVLGVETGQYCAGIDAAGAAQSWSKVPGVQNMMLHAVKNAKAPIFFFQAKNDYDLSPTRVLSMAMKKAMKPFQVKIYSPFGKTVQDGHAFGYFGSAVWSNDVFAFLHKYCQAARIQPAKIKETNK